MLLDVLNKIDSNFYKRLESAESATSAGSVAALDLAAQQDLAVTRAIAEFAKDAEVTRKIVERYLNPRTVDEVV
jgi:hypothetical protein